MLMLNTKDLQVKLKENKFSDRNDFINNYLKVVQAGIPQCPKIGQFF